MLTPEIVKQWMEDQTKSDERWLKIEDDEIDGEIHFRVVDSTTVLISRYKKEYLYKDSICELTLDYTVGLLMTSVAFMYIVGEDTRVYNTLEEFIEKELNHDEE